MNKRTFVLLPSGRFISFVGGSYFCGYYRGEKCPPRPIKTELEFPFDYLMVSFEDNVLKVNRERCPYRYITYSALSKLPLPHVGCQNSTDLGCLERLDSLVVEGGTLSVNGSTYFRLRDFPRARFEMSQSEIRRANRFIALGFNRVGLVYALYKPILFMSFEKDCWMTFNLRICDGLGNLGIER